MHWCAGVATDSILDAYTVAMKVLRIIDSSGNILEAIAEPIKAYLRSRPDTIRCVVQMLTQDTGASSSVSVLPCFQLIYVKIIFRMTAKHSNSHVFHRVLKQGP